MQEAINRATKLIERKQAFVLNVESPRAKDAILAEINIINGLIFQLQEQQNTAKHLEEINKKKQEANDYSTQKLFAVCELHGIDLTHYIFCSLEFLHAEIERDKKGNYKRIPQQLIQTFYGEKD